MQEGVDLVERRVAAGGRTLALLVPRDSEALLDEQASTRRSTCPTGPSCGRARAGRGGGRPAPATAGPGARLWPRGPGAADVLYESRDGPPLLAALARLVAPGGEAWIADPGRRASGAFLSAAEAAWRIDAVAHGGPEPVTVHRLRTGSAWSD